MAGCCLAAPSFEAPLLDACIEAQDVREHSGISKRLTIRTVRFDTTAPVTARYLRVTPQNYGLLPVCHEGAGKPAYLFTDEILVQ